jgi:maleate isomerase
MAIVDALRAINCDTIALVSPYPEWLTKLSVAYWESPGIRVSQLVSTGETFRAYELESDEVSECLKRIKPGNHRAVVIPGTGLLTLPAILGSPKSEVTMLSSNICGAWWLCRQAKSAASPTFRNAAPQLAALLD